MKKAIYAAVAALLVAGCGKDKDLSPSGLDRNWFAVEDSSDPVDHLRYEIYSQTGIALFRNDTIGSIDRGLDALGNPYVYYEVLDVNYAITSRAEVATYELSEDDDAVIAGLELMRDRVIPILPGKLYPRCFLLVGRLDIDQKKNRKGEASAYRGMMTTAVGRLNSIKTMSDAEKKRLAAEIAAEVISVYLVNERATELEDFYAKADASTQGGDKISLYDYVYDIKETNSSATSPVFKDWKEYGFLVYDTSDTSFNDTAGSRSYKTVGQRRDVETFLVEVLLGDDDGFGTTYADYPLILEKYALLKALWAEIGEELQ